MDGSSTVHENPKIYKKLLEQQTKDFEGTKSIHRNLLHFHSLTMKDQKLRSIIIYLCERVIAQE